MPETNHVKFISDEESFLIHYTGEKLLGQAFSDKVMSVVIIPGFRKTLEDIGKNLSRNN